MLKRVKSLLKVQFEDDNGPLRLMALMQILKGPTNAVLNCSALNETILILMNAFHNYPLKPIGSHLRKELQTHACERNRPIIPHFLR